MHKFYMYQIDYTDCWHIHHVRHNLLMKFCYTVKAESRVSDRDSEGASNSYKTAMWAILSTLFVVLIAVGLVLFIFWRRHK